MRRNRKAVLMTGVRVTLVLAVLAGAGSARAGEPVAQEQNMAEARRQFQAGVNLLDDPDGAKYEEAHNAFRKAYELSQSPKVLGNIGFCAMHLERDGEAIDAYTTYLAEAPDVPERERAQIQKDLATLVSTIARVRVVVKRPPGRFVLVDTRIQTRGPSIENAYPFDGTELTIRLRPGRHTLKVKTENEESLPVETALEPTAQVSHELSFAPPKPAVSPLAPARRSPSVAGPVILGVTALVAVGVGTAAGLVARSKTKDIESRCPNDVCPSDYDLDARRTSAKTFGTIADASFVGGGALLGGALLWYVLLPRSTSASSSAWQSPPATAWQSSAMCTQVGCNLQLQRGF